MFGPWCLPLLSLQQIMFINLITATLCEQYQKHWRWRLHGEMRRFDVWWLRPQLFQWLYSVPHVLTLTGFNVIFYNFSGAMPRAFILNGDNAPPETASWRLEPSPKTCRLCPWKHMHVTTYVGRPITMLYQPTAAYLIPGCNNVKIIINAAYI